MLFNDERLDWLMRSVTWPRATWHGTNWQWIDALAAAPMACEDIANCLAWSCVNAVTRRQLVRAVAAAEEALCGIPICESNERAFKRVGELVHFCRMELCPRLPDPSPDGGDYAHLCELLQSALFFPKTSGAQRLVDAMRNLRELSGARANLGDVINAFVHAVRLHSQSVSHEQTLTAADVMVSMRAKASRALLRRDFLGHANCPDGYGELYRFVGAVCEEGDDDDDHEGEGPTRLDLAVSVIRQFIWQVKRRLAGLSVEAHVVPVLMGVQGCGKSTAVKRLVSPLEEVCVPNVSASLLTDERSTAILSHAFIGVWDELAGATRAEMEALKNTVTASGKAYRMMKTNMHVFIDVNMTLIATTNCKVSSMLRDRTGNRRFFEIRCRPKIDWDVINNINYNLIWRTAVSEANEPPIQLFADDIAAAQVEDRFLDSVDSWLECDDFTGTSNVLPEGGPQLGLCNPLDGLRLKDLFVRYNIYCQASVEKYPIPMQSLGGRLQELGWIKRRQMRDGKRENYYFAPRAFLDRYMQRGRDASRVVGVAWPPPQVGYAVHAVAYQAAGLMLPLQPMPFPVPAAAAGVAGGIMQPATAVACLPHRPGV